MKKICFIVSSKITVDSFLLNHFEVLSKEFQIYLVGNFNTFSISPFVYETHFIKLTRKINLLNDLIVTFKLFLYIKKNKFDSVQTITPKAGFIGILAAFLSGVKNRIHTFTGQVWATKVGVSRFALMFFDKIISELSTSIIVDGKSQFDFLVNKKIINTHNSFVLGFGSISGVNIVKFCPREELKKRVRYNLDFNENHIVFSFLGRLNKDKGILDLVKAFKMLEKEYDFIKLIIIGVDEENIIKTVKKMTNTDSILFLGFCDKPEEILQASDIFCMPSYREGFCTSIIEASALSLPVIASDAYGLLDTIIDGETGLRHKAGNVEDIYEKMKKLLLNNDLRKRYGINGREFILKNLSSDSISNEWFKFYQNILK